MKKSVCHLCLPACYLGIILVYSIALFQGSKWEIANTPSSDFLLGHSNLITCLVVLQAFFGKKILSDSKKKEKKVTFGVLRTKVVLKFSVRLQKKKKKCKF